MANEPSTSFSKRQRWGIFFSVLVSIVAVLGLVGMLNYLGARHYLRFNASREAAIRLSPQTISLLKHITNQVNVTIYYNKSDPLYGSVAALLNEYHLVNQKVSVQTVDYLVDAALAQQVKSTNKLGSGEDKNLVIFNSGGHRKIILGSQLSVYGYQAIPNQEQPEWNRELKAFEGEKWFSAALLNVTDSKPMNAYFVEGHGEHSLEGTGDYGYQKFGQVLAQNNILTSAIRLHGTNAIPADCNLLIIAGPQTALPKDELEKIRQYLNQGGRLFVLFNFYTKNFPTGLETLLAEWNLDIGMNIVSDVENAQSGNAALVISDFKRSHPLMAPLFRSSLVMVQPRSITAGNKVKDGPEAPKVVDLAQSGRNSTRSDFPRSNIGPVPVIATAEKGTLKGILPEHGTTAILAVGDSVFLTNQLIDEYDNREFAGLAVNWLLDQTHLLEGIGPHPVKQYKLLMTNAQMSSVRWLFLAAMPGAILIFGVLVWFRRRH